MNDFQNNATGGISFSAPTWSFGNTNADINSGFSFDLPLATIQAFSNNALSFTSNNSDNNRGFLDSVINRSQSNVTTTADRAYAYQTQALSNITQISDQMKVTLDNATKRRSRGCFISTAICTADGKPDHCEELETLRAFRDRVMVGDAIRRADLETYYEIAPEIVAALDRHEESVFVYAILRDSYLVPAIDFIKHGEYDRAYSLYVEMVQTAQQFAREVAQ